MKAIAIAIDPKGVESFCAYGPLTNDKNKAMKFVSATIAERAILNRFGRTDTAFWNSERLAQDFARKKFAGWTYRIEETP